MGDVGSLFIGFFMAGLAIVAHIKSIIPIESSLILHSVFIVDSGVTLITRASRGLKIYQAHKDHAYQHATQHGLSHQRTTIYCGLINLLWLAPIAWAATNAPNLSAYLWMLANLPLLWLAIILKAGRQLSN